VPFSARRSASKAHRHGARERPQKELPMTRPISQTDLEEIDAFLAEHEGASADSDPLEDDASIDQLITQLEASFATVTQLTEQAQTGEQSLRDMVHTLALRLEDIATELAQINQRLNP